MGEIDNNNNNNTRSIISLLSEGPIWYNIYNLWKLFFNHKLILQMIEYEIAIEN